jgi:hypothetical protein
VSDGNVGCLIRLLRIIAALQRLVSQTLLLDAGFDGVEVFHARFTFKGCLHARESGNEGIVPDTISRISRFSRTFALRPVPIAMAALGP